MNESYRTIGKTHGASTDNKDSRKVGDIGNITADESGLATVKLEDALVHLFGPHSVIGRSIVVCAGEDDAGRGGQEKSLETGNAGPVVGMGVIGMAAPSS